APFPTRRSSDLQKIFYLFIRFGHRNDHCGLDCLGDRRDRVSSAQGTEGRPATNVLRFAIPCGRRIEMRVSREKIFHDPAPRISAPPRAFHETWYLKLNLPQSEAALWLQFHLLISVNGFRKNLEIQAAFFDPAQAPGTRITSLRQIYPLTEGITRLALSANTLSVQGIQFSREKTEGILRAR